MSSTTQFTAGAGVCGDVRADSPLAGPTNATVAARTMARDALGDIGAPVPRACACRAGRSRTRNPTSGGAGRRSAQQPRHGGVVSRRDASRPLAGVWVRAVPVDDDVDVPAVDLGCT